jgi:hypothetical protein
METARFLTLLVQTMLKPYKFSGLNKKILRRRFFLHALILTTTAFILVSCTETVWKNHGDSCIQISEDPPLRRVINYSDHDLCGRKLSPRIAPNPQTRSKTEKD